MATLLNFQRLKGKPPQALLDMPFIDAAHEELVSHFHVLSRSRSYFSEAIPNKNGAIVSFRRPNPIDISSIIRYNHNIARVLSDQDFLEIIQTLDHIFLTKKFKQ